VTCVVQYSHNHSQVTRGRETTLRSHTQVCLSTPAGTSVYIVRGEAPQCVFCSGECDGLESNLRSPGSVLYPREAALTCWDKVS